MEQDKVQRRAILLELLRRLRGIGNWGGETHLQKATFLLQDGMGVDVGYEFVLYKHGPFSFPLRNELHGLVGDSLIGHDLKPAPYGPSLRVTEVGEAFLERHRNMLDYYEKEIEETASVVGSSGVMRLERLATALMLARKEPTASDSYLVERLREIKPHIDVDRAMDAVREARELRN